MTLPHPTREHIEHAQLQSLRRLVRAQLDHNPFYAERLKAAGITKEPESIQDFTARAPLLTKEQLRQTQTPDNPYGALNPKNPVRLHQTSSTTGEPLRWPDTQRNWDAMVHAWTHVLQAAGITHDDRVFAAASFGPFIGFWLGFEAAIKLGCLVIPGGGMTTEIRLRAITANDITAVLCTPTYAIRLGETARDNNIDLSKSNVKTLIVAGEPGGSIPAVRERIADLWHGARVFDHHGMTESGPITHECPDHPGSLHVIEHHILPEFINPKTTEPVEPDGETVAELVITTLERIDSPAIRYRTGDLVKPAPLSTSPSGRNTRTLMGGVLARADDMVIVRGVNLYPSALDNTIRTIPTIDEYQVHVTESRGMTELKVHIEPTPNTNDPTQTAEQAAKQAAEALRAAFGLRIPVEPVPQGALPRAEFKSKRWIRS